MKNTQNLLLLILDGWGIDDNTFGNAIKAVETPFIDELEKSGYALIANNGTTVGLPDGQMGNSEVGHLNIGAGRVVMQDLQRINSEIETGEFYQEPLLVEAMDKAKGGALHLMGLVSDGGVHSKQEHLYSLLKMAKQQGLNKVYIHAFLDGRDVPPTSGKASIEDLEKTLQQIGTGKTATVTGRYYAMDRDKRWDRVEKAYQAIVLGEGARGNDPVSAIQASYESGVNDEFVSPIIVDGDYSGVEEGDTVIFFNFRPDRAREITEAFTQKDFSGFERKDPNVHFYCLTEYDKSFGLPVIYRKELPQNTLGEVISAAGLKQFRIAETEKYAHVTFFFNGGKEQVYENEERMLIPSPKVSTYDLKPEMSAPEVTENLVKVLKLQEYNLVICNFANPDMVGHTGIMEAAKKAVTVIDDSVRQVVTAARENNYSVMITADHGNVEKMCNMEGKPFTSHTMTPTPFYYLGRLGLKEKDGALCDIAPSALFEMGLEIPKEMTGKVLIG